VQPGALIGRRIVGSNLPQVKEVLEEQIRRFSNAQGRHFRSLWRAIACLMARRQQARAQPASQDELGAHLPIAGTRDARFINRESRVSRANTSLQLPRARSNLQPSLRRQRSFWLMPRGAVARTGLASVAECLAQGPVEALVARRQGLSRTPWRRFLW
jgi:hypothetical protein